MADPKSQLVTFPLAVGMDNVSLDEVVQPVGERPRVRLSRNTRLTKVPGLASKAPGATLLASGLGAYCGGIVPIAGREATALFRHPPAEANQRVTGQNLSDIYGVVNAIADSFVPISVESAGHVPGGRTNYNVAAAYDPATGYTWYARPETRFWSSAQFVYVSVIADDGRLIGFETRVTTTTSDANPENFFFGLTTIGGRVFLWHGSTTNAIQAARLVLNADLSISAFSATTVYTPVSRPTFGNVALAYDHDDNTYVYLACRDSATANSVRVMRIDVTGTTPSITTGQTHAMGAAWTYLALAYKASDAVLLAVSLASTSSFFELSYTALTATWSQTGRLTGGLVGCGFYWYRDLFSAGESTRLFAASEIPGASIADDDGTKIEVYSTSGVLNVDAAGSCYLPHRILCGQICTHKISATAFYPLIPTINLFANTGSTDPTSTAYVSEPSVELYRPGDRSMLSCVARLGVDRVVRYSGATYTSGGLNSCVLHGDRMLVTYLDDNVEEGVAPNGYRARYAWLDLASKQPAYAIAPGGAALIAGALPAVWDGNELTEHSPLRAPVVVVSDAGSAPSWSGSPATYLFAAVVYWRDATGRIHRSAPSNVATLTGTGVQPLVHVYVPRSYRKSFSGHGVREWIDVTLYVSEPDGLVLYAQPYASGGGGIMGRFGYTGIAQPVVNANTPALYTDGSAAFELANYCPNASRAVAVVSDRAWLIDAEHPSRAPYSKPVVNGYAPEFNPDQVIDFPASAGEMLAIVDWNGTPLFLGASGLWMVAGEGPDALLNPPFFAAPAQVSDIPCTQAASVVRTPAGVMYVSHNRFVIFDGAPRIVFEIDPTAGYGDIVFTAIFRKYQEVCFFTSIGYVCVYNWQADSFTLWDQTVTGVTSIVAGAQVPATGKALYYGDAGELWLLDPDTVSTAAQISINTGWVVLGGAQDWNTLANLILHARRAGAHALQIDISVDYDEATVSSKTYSASEVLDLVKDQTLSLRYDAVPEPSDQNARAVRLTFTESGATGEAFQPIHCTVEVLKQSGKSSRSYGDVARR